jgi:hypothetical protein
MSVLSVWIFGFLLGSALNTVPDVDSVSVLWKTTDRDFPAEGTASVMLTDDVTLELLVRFKDGTCAVRSTSYYQATTLRTCDRSATELSHLRVLWWRLEPRAMFVPRSARGVGPALEFQQRLFGQTRADRFILAETTIDDGTLDAQAGTARFSATLLGLNDETLAQAPGPEAPERAFVMRVRSGNDLVGMAHELLGVPYADAARGAPPALHETELMLAASDWTLPIYAARRMGLSLPYAGFNTLRSALTEVKLGHAQAGDVVLVNDAVGLLVHDRGKRGAVEPTDMVLTAWKGSARVVPVQSLSQGPIHVYRFTR